MNKMDPLWLEKKTGIDIIDNNAWFDAARMLADCVPRHQSRKRESAISHAERKKRTTQKKRAKKQRRK